MLSKLISLRSVLFFVITLAYFVNCAPVNDRLSRSPIEGVKLSHITREDVELLKQQLQELEEDLTALEPAIPTEVTAVDDEEGEDDDDFEPADEEDNDEVEDIVEDVPVNGALPPYAGHLLEELEAAVDDKGALPADPEDEGVSNTGGEDQAVVDDIAALPADPEANQDVSNTGGEDQAVVDDIAALPVNPEANQDVSNTGGEDQAVLDVIGALPADPETEQDAVDTAAEDQVVVDGSEITVVRPLVDTDEEDDIKGWEEGEFVPYRDPVEEDLYLQELILKALTVLYRKDVDRIDRMMWNYYHNLAQGDDEILFPENAQPVPQDLAPNPGNVEQHVNAGADAGLFEEAPVAKSQFLAHDDLVVEAAERTRELDIADIDGEWEEGAIQVGVVDEIGDDVETPNNPPIADKKPIPAEEKVPGLPVDIDHDVEDADEAVDGQETNVEADELLAELMASLNTSLQKFNEQKAQGRGRDE